MLSRTRRKLGYKAEEVKRQGVIGQEEDQYDLLVSLARVCLDEWMSDINDCEDRISVVKPAFSKGKKLASTFEVALFEEDSVALSSISLNNDIITSVNPPLQFLIVPNDIGLNV